MRKAEDFKTVSDLGLQKITGTYLLKWFGSVDRIIFEGRRAAYLKSYYGYDFIDVNGSEKSLSTKTARELIEAMQDNDLLRNDLDVIFHIGLLYSSLGHSEYVASFTDIKLSYDRKNESCSQISYAEANWCYENITTPTPRQLAELRMAIAARLSPEECIVIMLRLSGHIGESEVDETLARRLGIRDEETARMTRQSAILKLMGVYGDNPLPPFPIPADEIMPNFS